MLTTTQFRDRFPEFCDKTDYPDNRVSLFIDDTLLYVGEDENHWGGVKNYNRAQAYIAAHLLYKASKSEAGDNSGSSGPIVSKSAGGVSVSRASANLQNKTSSEIDLMSTVYGTEFISIRDMCFAGVMVAIYA